MPIGEVALDNLALLGLRSRRLSSKDEAFDYPTDALAILHPVQRNVTQLGRRMRNEFLERRR